MLQPSQIRAGQILMDRDTWTRYRVVAVNAEPACLGGSLDLEVIDPASADYPTRRVFADEIHDYVLTAK